VASSLLETVAYTPFLVNYFHTYCCSVFSGLCKTLAQQQRYSAVSAVVVKSASFFAQARTAVVRRPPQTRLHLVHARHHPLGHDSDVVVAPVAVLVATAVESMRSIVLLLALQTVVATGAVTGSAPRPQLLVLDQPTLIVVALLLPPGVGEQGPGHDLLAQ